MITRRTLLMTGAASAGVTVVLPYAAMAAAQSGHSFDATGGQVTIHPVSHASFVMETPAGVIYADPVGEPAQYADFPEPELILLTHHHGDHFAPETLSEIVGQNTRILANPTVFEQMSEGMKARTTEIANGQSETMLGVEIEAIPAYNTTEGRLKYHPEGRDNGYILNFEGLRVYIAGDTEDIPEMRNLRNIDVAFLPMNLPYTMTEEQAASAVAAFKPAYVYPYHYKGSDPEKFASLVAEQATDTEVKQGPWYEENADS